MRAVFSGKRMYVRRVLVIFLVGCCGFFGCVFLRFYEYGLIGDEMVLGGGGCLYFIVIPCYFYELMEFT